eukprot:3396146-Alexandrium_andersonii.AAC.1
MAWARLVLQSRWGPPTTTAEQADLLQVAGVSSQPPLNLAEEALGHRLLGPVQVRVTAGEGEVVTVRQTSDIPTRAINATHACLSPNEPEALQGGRAQGSPSRWRRALGTHAGFRHLWRQRYVDVVLYIGVQ